MGCQRAIARKIIEKKADYVFGLKGDQGSLREDVEAFGAEQKARNFKDTTISRAETIENSLHWVMDMVFRDDECRVRTNHAPANFTTIKHMAHNLLRRPSGKNSFRLRCKVAGWDDEFLASLVTA